MKITSLRAYQVDLPYVGGTYFWGKGNAIRVAPTTVIVVETDAGIIGCGESCPIGGNYLAAYPEGVVPALAQLAPAVMGQDPRHIHRIERLMDNALMGHPYAKTAIDAACWDILGQSISPGPCAGEQVALAEVFPGGRETPRLSVDPMVDALSTRNFRLREESGHNQFFATFARFAEASFGRRGEMLAEVTHRAGRQNIVYLELMQSLGMLEAAELGKATADLDADLGQRVDYAEVDKIAAAVVAQVDVMEAKARVVNRCDSDTASVGCKVKVRYLAQVLRTWEPQEVYVQTVLAYKLIEADPRIVGLNFVAPEDHPVALRDYRMHMRFIAEIGTLFPEQTKGITLHSG